MTEAITPTEILLTPPENLILNAVKRNPPLHAVFIPCFGVKKPSHFRENASRRLACRLQRLSVGALLEKLKYDRFKVNHEIFRDLLPTCTWGLHVKGRLTDTI